MDNQNFHLKIGATLIDMANSEMNCCHRDMTDEKAIYHLNFAIAYDKANPNPYKPMLNTTLEKFSNMPENWKDLLSGIPQKNDHLTIPSIKELLRAKAYVDKDFTFKSKEALLEMLSKP